MTWKGWEDYAPKMTFEGLAAAMKAHEGIKAPQPAKASKYHAVKTDVDGITFDSKKEAARYQALLLRQRAGEIRGLALQVPFVLRVGSVDLGKYIADFVYEERIGEDWCHRCEDVKGFRTPLYRWKRKHVAAQFGITIQEI
jgi:hypothetical protein